jgi:hypothetical protein
MKKESLNKDYRLCDVSKNKANQIEFIKELKEKDSKVVEKIIAILDNHGLVYGFKKDIILKAIYLFKKEKDDEKYILKLEESIMTDEITDEMKDELERQLLEELSEYVAFEDYSKVVFNNKEVVPKTVRIGKTNVALGGLIFALGTIIGILFMGDSWYLGVCIGLFLGSGCSEIIKKRKRK